MTVQQTRETIKALATELVSLADTYDPSSTGSWGLDSDVAKNAKAILAAIRSPYDHAIGMVSTGIEVAALRTLVFLKVFDAIPEAGSITLDKLSTATKTDKSFLTRLLRPFVGNGIVHQDTTGAYSHTSISRGYRSSEMSNVLFTCSYDEGIEIMVRLPEYLEVKHKGPDAIYEEPGSGLDSQAYNPWNWRMGREGEPNYTVLAEYPERMQRMHLLLGSIAHLNPFVGFYDFSKLALPPTSLSTSSSSPSSDNDDTRAVFVDVGGGHGFAITHLLAAHPDIRPEQCVLQDMASVVHDATTTAEPRLPAGVRTQAHDYFAPQPVRGARAYHLRAVAHNLSDASLLRVIAAITPAMAPDSRLLIADNVVPEQGARGLSAMMDLMMMQIGGKERSESDFRELLGRAGLKVEGVHRAEGERNYAMVEATLI